MNAPLAAIAQRRLSLSDEIGQQRAELGATLADLRNELAFAGLGLIAGRALIRRPLLRMLVLGGLAAVAAKRLATRRQT